MGRSNTANGGANYFDLAIQLVAADAGSYTLRAVVYLQSLPVTDTSNSLDVSTVGTGGGHSRSGVLGLGGSYSYVPVWSQDIVYARIGSAYGITVSASWSGVNYWGTTLTAQESYVIPAQESSTPTGPPNAPITVANTPIFATSAGVAIPVPGALNGESADFCEYHLYRGAPAGSPGAVLVSAIGGVADPAIGYAGGMWPVTLTRFTVYWSYGRTHSASGFSPWNGPNAFRTLAAPPVIGAGYSATSITRDTAVITNLSISDNGGSAVDNVRVQHNTAADTTGAVVVTRGSWGDVTLTSLPAAALRYYRVAAHNGAGWGSYGAWKSFTTLSGSPSSPAAPTFSGVTDTAMTATWVEPALNGATLINYSWGVSLTSDFATLVASGTTTSLSASITGLLPGTRYWWRVRVNATPNNSGYGTAQQLTTGVTPESGLRAYADVPDVGIRLCTMYAHVGGSIKQIRPMWQNGSVLQTE